MPEMKISFLGTGSGSSTNRAHSAMVYDCDDNTRLLVDASSGNSVARNASELGMSVADFDTVLLSHHHPDHMSGLLFVQFSRAFYEKTPRHWMSTSQKKPLNGPRKCVSLVT